MINDQNLGGFISTVVTLPFIVIMAVVILVMARAARKARASKSWPSTAGRITHAEVTSHWSSDNNGGHTMMYKPVIAYEYVVDGQSHHSQQISYGAVDSASMSSWAERIVARYPLGSQAQVFYNPANPSEAVLEHSGEGGNLALTAIFVVVEIILVGLLIFGLTGHFD